jgi:hypothetical protein
MPMCSHSFLDHSLVSVMTYIPWSNQFMLDSLKGSSSSHLIELWIFMSLLASFSLFHFEFTDPMRCFALYFIQYAFL